MNLALWLERHARTDSSRTAVFAGARPWKSFGRLARDVASLARGMREKLALAPGDRVAIVMTNAPEYAEVLLAAWWAGLAAVPVNAKLHPREVAWILADSGARAAFVTPDRVRGLAEAAAGLEKAPDVIEAGSVGYDALFAEPMPVAEVPDGALAWLFYTSGTTGRPKGAMLSHANLRAMAQGYLTDVDAVTPADCLLHAAPMSHGSGLYLVPYLLAGAAQVVPESGGFDAAEVFALAEAHGGAGMFAAPTIVRRLVEHAASHAPRLDGLRTVVYGGGPMYVADLLRAIEVMGPRFAQIYGQGESPMTITALAKRFVNDRAHPRHLARIASVGLPQSGVEVAVRDESGRDLPAGEVGEICVRGAAVMSGYWENPQATAKALREGWLWTGDLGAFDEEGFLTLKDRSKDLIISGGSNIYPREVEEALLAHPGVAEVSVVGRPDPEWGEAVVAFVVAREPAPTPAELDAHCLAAIARFKRPKEYRFVRELPKNNYGKVLKTELRAIL
ncbi:MAG: long-chain fatty acid--CoA ligase [Betaproteobacteria bacterium]|nr:long-chain fatty acid--CoA ligase [Betaproteobacteria bacterium]